MIEIMTDADWKECEELQPQPWWTAFEHYANGSEPSREPERPEHSCDIEARLCEPEVSELMSGTTWECGVCGRILMTGAA